MIGNGSPAPFLPGVISRILPLLALCACATVSTQTLRYEIQVPLSKTDEDVKAVVKRETIVRSAISDFGGVLVEQHTTTGFDRASNGEVRSRKHWKIIFDTAGARDSEKVPGLLNRIEEAFGSSDVSLVRYPIERVE